MWRKMIYLKKKWNSLMYFLMFKNYNEEWESKEKGDGKKEE